MVRVVVGLIFIIMSAGITIADPVRPKARPEINRDCVKQASPNQCMKCMIYHEARGTSLEGQIAVALVVHNRVASPRFPDTICEVVWQSGYSKKAGRRIGQFSFTTDGASDRMHETAAVVAIDGVVKMAKTIHQNQLGAEYIGVDRKVLWYHTTSVAPSWSRVFKMVTQIGTHRFYRK